MSIVIYSLLGHYVEYAAMGMLSDHQQESVSPAVNLSVLMQSLSF